MLIRKVSSIVKKYGLYDFGTFRDEFAPGNGQNHINFQKSRFKVFVDLKWGAQSRWSSSHYCPPYGIRMKWPSGRRTPLYIYESTRYRIVTFQYLTARIIVHNDQTNPLVLFRDFRKYIKIVDMIVFFKSTFIRSLD